MRQGRWFPGATLNFAANLLPRPDDREVLVTYAEGCERSSWSGLRLWNDVARCAASLRAAGVDKGDRVAGVLSNGPEAVIAMLAATSLGAVWSSCSPDFGTRGIADRLTQIQPKIVFATNRYLYSGKSIECNEMITAACARIEPMPRLVFVDHFHRGSDGFATFLGESGLDGNPSSPHPIKFEPCGFDDPLYILFSSGTTGLPKCIVHGVGRTLAQHKKELMLHSDVHPGDKLFYFTTCGWMMWNWMVSALSCGACIVTFDGNPAHPSASRLWDICAAERVTHFGTSPKFIAASMHAGPPARWRDLRVILSTGSPLLPAHFEWVYDNYPGVQLASISGGTDIVSCFMLGNPLLPVRVGAIQAAGLGMAIEAWNSDNKPVVGEKGELVCVRPFVSMPIGFFNDNDGAKYRAAYFDHYPGQDVWRHGDFVEIGADGGVVVYGRSDATLNPGGVRIGTAEIYRSVETIDFVIDSIAVGQDFGDDTRVILFVKVSGSHEWTDSSADRIKKKIRAELTPRHVPAMVIPVKDIPYTRSGKKIEMVVTQAINGRPVTNRESIANPESLGEYERLRLT
jgi:acetoacetyl-CoA synthetase